jgi:1,4-alpha-glucan branching enzyme
VTGARLDLAFKQHYDPYWANKKAVEHAAHYAGLVEELVSDFHRQNGKFGIIAAAYDTELLGHWWFEGVDWLKEVLRRLASSEVVEQTTASDYIEQHPPEDVLALKEGSWGQAGNHFTWLNIDTHWMWPLVHRAERRMEELAQRHPGATGLQKELLEQAARELLLLESSDWPFLVTTGQAREYAVERFNQHLERFNQLAEMVEAGRLHEEARRICQELWELDKVFPDIDYVAFANREGKYEKVQVG